MGIRKINPTSPGQRGMSKSDYSEITTDKPEKSLVKRLKKNTGRNNTGRITCRHKGGGHKRLYRTIDFKRNKIGVPAVVKCTHFCFYFCLDFPVYSGFLRLSNRTEQLHFRLNGFLDRFRSGSQELSRVIPLSFLILARLDILSRSLGKGQLALGIDVDLRNA